MVQDAVGSVYSSRLQLPTHALSPDFECGGDADRRFVESCRDAEQRRNALVGTSTPCFSEVMEIDFHGAFWPEGIGKGQLLWDSMFPQFVAPELHDAEEGFVEAKVPKEKAYEINADRTSSADRRQIGCIRLDDATYVQVGAHFEALHKTIEARVVKMNESFLAENILGKNGDSALMLAVSRNLSCAKELFRNANHYFG